MKTAENYLRRCMALAQLGRGFVAPNPMVGAVLVYDNRIIGEGYHQKYGEAHAEVNCINSVAEIDKPFISEAVLYVSLEPCAHFGKTPPCSLLIIEYKIPKVVIGCRDPFEAVNGKGIEQLKAAGVEVEIGVLEGEAKDLNKRFFAFHEQKRPYIILKWAETVNRKMAGLLDERLMISNAFSNRLVHQWRSEEAAILVGTNTALKDNPSLTNRLWTGNHPIRLVLDKNLRLPTGLHLFNRQIPTIVFNQHQQKEEPNLRYHQMDMLHETIPELLKACYTLNIQSILVEGGASLLQSFIDAGLWNEARVITSETCLVQEGLDSPSLKQHQLIKTSKVASDTIRYFHQLQSSI